MKSFGEASHFVEAAPRLGAIVASSEHGSLDTQLTFWQSEEVVRDAETLPADTLTISMTEGAALQQTHDFLSAVVTHEMPLPDRFGDDLRDTAYTMRENLSFISERARAIATTAMAGSWKRHLAQSSHHRIIVAPSNVTEDGNMKSGDFLFNQVMEKFTEDERARFAAQVSRDFDTLPRFRSAPDTKIIVLDDWSVSGTHLLKILGDVKVHPRAGKAQLEVNLLAATNAQLAEPLQHVPTAAYYQVDRLGNSTLVTGSHSAVDFSFGRPMEQMVSAFGALGKAMTLPALANVKRPYYRLAA